MSHSVYLFRHIQTQQVIVSTQAFAKNKALKQLDIATRPVRLRKDLWRPLVAVTGFSTPQSAQAVSDALLQRSKERQLALVTSEEYLAKPKRLRLPESADLVEKSVLSLSEALESVATKHLGPDVKLSALWEQPRFVDMAPSWPAFVDHGQLQLKNNRLVSATSP